MSDAHPFARLNRFKDLIVLGALAVTVAGGLAALGETSSGAVAGTK